ncbi:hypothetical protein [Pseudomonas sp. nanlin1]|uniref:hypothetical protein n=1 Tax=Pseudomonas sp. nanlin1 TaxID=3040605 RepID=UPI00388F5DE3
MNDDLRAEPDLDQPAVFKPRRKPRSKNWLAYQIALGIILGGSVLWTLATLISFAAARLLLGQWQVTVPGLTH